MTNKYRGFCHRCGTERPAGTANLIKQDGKWLVECLAPCEPKPKAAPAPKPTTTVGDVAGIIALFNKAKAHLKYPAIELGVADHPAIRINVAGEQARVPGSLTVLSAEREDDGRSWFGRILQDGIFQPSRDLLANPSYAAAVTKRLAEFAANPSKVGGEDGRLHGRCCFCRIPLKDERSTLAGYGKKCASNFGLEWGAKPAEFAADKPATSNAA